jgi:cytochrome P450
LSWAFERVLRHPEVYSRLRAEVDDRSGRFARSGEGLEGAGGGAGTSGGTAGAGEGPYLDAVVKETMRLCPAAPIVVRKLLEPMELGGYQIPAGTTVAPCVHLVHRNAAIYPEPLAFRPERFLERPAGAYTWIPFGGGVRRCLAAPYAQMLMREVIGAVVRDVELSVSDPRSERARKSAIAFVPEQHGVVVADHRRYRADDTPEVEPVHATRE